MACFYEKYQVWGAMSLNFDFWAPPMITTPPIKVITENIFMPVTSFSQMGKRLEKITIYAI